MLSRLGQSRTEMGALKAVRANKALRTQMPLTGSVSAHRARRTRGVVAALVAALTFVLATSGVQANSDLPHYAADKHEGVGSCAGGQCHGKIAAASGRSVRLDEHTIWREEDRHSKAYQTLLNDKSKRIARNLGIGAPHEADMCLDCHADNVPEEKQGREFHLSDGVGCEACHGGGERYLETHKAKDATHASNIADGLYPTEDRKARAALCLSCHLGTDQKFTTHRIMGAGHPRLRFDMEYFEIKQPYHYDLDDDYVERKLEPDSLLNWTAGVTESAIATLDLIEGKHFTRGGVFPDVALFDCHACHHPMSQRNWRTHSATRALGPGEVRLNDGYFQMISAIADVVAPAEGKKLKSQLSSMHKGIRGDRGAVVKAAGGLRETIKGVRAALEGGVSSANARKILVNILDRAARHEYHDRISAEQATYAVDTILYALELDEANADRVERLYKAAGARGREVDETLFDADKLRFDYSGFVRTMSDIKKQVM